MTTDEQHELLTQVNNHNEIIGPIERNTAHNTKGVYYRTIYVVIKNTQNQILLQKRSRTKDLYPNYWDLSVGGHVAYGDSYMVTAVRELKEELGLTVDADELNFVSEVLVRLPRSNEFFNVYEYKLKDVDAIELLADEVASIKWMTIEDIKESIETRSLEWYTRPIQVVQALY